MTGEPVRVRIRMTPGVHEGSPRSPFEAALVAPVRRGPGYGAVMIDVLRTTTSLAHAFAAGTRTALFFADPDAALAARARVRAPALTAGEREGRPIPGFDLGNSPRDYTPERVGGAALLFASTNGSLAFLSTYDAAVQWSVAFANLEAGVRAASTWLLAPERAAALAAAPRLEGEPDLLIVCAGKLGVPCVEDAGCAGRFALRLMDVLSRAGRDVRLQADGGVLAHAPESEEETRALLAQSEHGRYLTTLGPEYVADVEECARWDVLEVAPAGHGARLLAGMGAGPAPAEGGGA